MAKVLLPKHSGKGTLPQANSTRGSLEKTAPNDLTPMNFKVPTEFHREFKAYAALHGISMLELLQESFRLVKEHRGE